MASDAVKRKKGKKKLGVCFWNCTASLSIKSCLHHFPAWDYLNQQKLSEKEEGASGKRESPRQMVVKGNPDSC